MNVSPFGESLGTLDTGTLTLGGRYHVERLLGSGGMGAVYLVTHVSLNELRALKVIRPDVLRDDAALQRFRREAQVQSRVRHPNVVTVHDFGETGDNNVWMVLEYADGVPLDDLLTSAGPLSPERTATIMLGVCRGVAAAHAAGIVHRDLKPGNILITRGPGGRELPKVLDFGIARPIALSGAQPSAVARLTSTNMFVGTPAYLSPDQLTETVDQPLDTRSDVYTIALIVIELLTGGVPLRSSTIAEMLQRTVQPVPTLSTLRPDVSWPPAVEAAIARAAHMDRDQRTPSTLEFADEFCHAVIGAGLGEASRIFPEWTRRAVPVIERTPMNTQAVEAVAPPRSGRWPARLGLAALAGAVALWLALGTEGRPAGDPMPTARDTSAAVPRAGTADPGTAGPGAAPVAVGGVAPRTVTSPALPPTESLSGRAREEALERTALAVAALLTRTEAGEPNDEELRSRIRDAETLLTQVTRRADSVALGYVALEAEVLLSRDTDACRRLQWLRGRAKGGRFEAAIGLMADSLPCG